MKEKLDPLMQRIGVNTHLAKQSQEGIQYVIGGFEAFSKLEWKEQQI